MYQPATSMQNYCGKLTFDQPLQYAFVQPQIPDTFANAVYQYVAKIPCGYISTYGRVAKVLGRPKSSRHVGSILSKNPYVGIVPCHRVIRTDGDIGGYFGDNTANGHFTKATILQGEGVPVVCVNGIYKVDMARAFIY